MSIFHYNKWESVKCSIKGLGRMDLVHILVFQVPKFPDSLPTKRYTVLPCVLVKNVII